MIKVNIIFSLTDVNNSEKKYIKPFCEYLVYNIQQDIFKKANWLKINRKSDDILNCNWVSWKKKPKRLNMYRVMKLITKNIVCNKCKNDVYIIQVKNNVRFPNTRNTLEQIVRFIDKGNILEKVLPTMCISDVFNTYTQRKINRMWREYVIYCINVLGDD